MGIISEIKKNKATVFRRLYMRRRESGGEYESDWQEIPSKYIISFGNISYDVDDVLPNFYKIRGPSLRLSNNDGYFSDITDDRSFFYQKTTRYKTLIKINAGYKDEDGNEFPTDSTLFVGLITDEMPYKNDNIVNVKTEHLTSIFEKLPADRIVGLGSTQSASDMVTKIKNHEDSNNVKIFQKFISSTAWTIATTTAQYNMATSTTLQNKSCWDLMKTLAGAENHILRIEKNGDFNFEPVSEISSIVSFHFSGIGDSDKSYGHNILEQISLEEDLRKVYNRVRVKHGKEDTTTNIYIKQESWDWGDSSSSDYYGVREYPYENEWLSSSTAETIATNIYNEFVQPKDIVKLKSKFVPQLDVQDRVSLTYKTRTYSGGDLWGYFLYGYGYWGERLGYNINIDGTEYRITKLKHNIDNFVSSETLREI